MGRCEREWILPEFSSNQNIVVVVIFVLSINNAPEMMIVDCSVLTHTVLYYQLALLILYAIMPSLIIAHTIQYTLRSQIHLLWIKEHRFFLFHFLPLIVKFLIFLLLSYFVMHCVSFKMSLRQFFLHNSFVLYRKI